MRWRAEEEIRASTTGHRHRAAAVPVEAKPPPSPPMLEWTVAYAAVRGLDRRQHPQHNIASRAC